MWNWKSSSPNENQAIQERYAALAMQHGEIFENKIESLTDDDLLDIEARKLKLSITWYVGSGVALGFVSAFILLSSPTILEIIFAIGLVAITVIGTRILLFRQLNEVLKSSEKRVIKGVITAKVIMRTKRKEIRNGCYFEISNTDKFQVWPDDYRKCDLGEIIRIEKLSEDIYIRPKVVKLGKI